MPVWSALPVLKVDESRMLSVDPQNPENLLGMWSVFHKCTGFIEDGRRLENMSWRVFAHETLCASQRKREQAASTLATAHLPIQRRSPQSVPQLSSSVDSTSSIEYEDVDDSSTDATTPADEMQLSFDVSQASPGCRRLKEKHITSANLKNLITSIKVKQDFTRPLSPLPLSMSETSLPRDYRAYEDTIIPSAPSSAPTPRPSSPRMSSRPSSRVSSRPPTRPSSPRPMERPAITRPHVIFEHLLSPATASNASAESNDSSHSIVRGFRPGKSISTYRSQSQLALSAMDAKDSSSSEEAQPLARRKGGMFTLGGSMQDEDSDNMKDNLSPMPHSSLRSPSKSLVKTKKHTSFADTVTEMQTKKTFILSSSVDEGAAIESDDEDDDAFDDTEDDVSDSAIADEDDDDVWEDEEEDSAPQPITFSRVDSKAALALTSHRSFLTQGLHDEERRSSLLQNMTSRSSPMLQSSRRSPRNGPSMPVSPDEEPEEPFGGPVQTTFEAVESSDTKPMIITTTNMQGTSPTPVALSPRATRRNMLAQELGVSLRKHMLNERQQRNFYAAPVLPRRHTTHDLKNLKDYPEASSSTQTPSGANQRKNSHQDYFEYGFPEYHQKGW